MPAASPLADHLSSAELRTRYLTASRRIEGIRWHALLLRSQGRTHAEIAEITQRSSRWVSEIVRRYNADGVAGITDQRVNNGKQPDLNDAQQDALRRLLQSPPPDGGLWTGLKVLAWIEEQVGEDRTLSMAYDYLHRLNFSQQTPRPHHRKADKDAQEAIKKGVLKQP